VLGRRRLHPTSLSASPTAMLRAQIAVRRDFLASTPGHALARHSPTGTSADEIRQLSAAADRRCEAELALAEGHRLLAAGDAVAARRELAIAAETFRGVKLAATLRLLAVAPSIAIALQRWRRGPHAHG
jgi:hypothetical protein